MKKKILFINGHINSGGVEKSLVDILRHLDYSKYDVELLLLEGIGDYADDIPKELTVRLVDIHNTYGSIAHSLLRCIKQRDWLCFKLRLLLFMQKFGNVGNLRHIRKAMFGKRKYDVAIGFRPGICTNLAAFAVDAVKRITWWHHGEINVDTKTYLETAHRCDRVVVVSESCRHMMASAFPSLEDKLVTIHNMLDVPSVKQKAEAFDPYPEKDILHIVSVGRLAPEKHFENAIFAARKLKDLGVSFRWHLVGDGVLREELHQKAQDADVTDCFIFEGNQVNPYPYVKNADLFVHPSYVESFGIVVTEALALGVPCVVTKSAGSCEYVVDGENGLLTEQSPESLTEKVIQILEDGSLYQRVKANTTCPKQFQLECVMAKIEAMLEETI